MNCLINMKMILFLIFFTSQNDLLENLMEKEEWLQINILILNINLL